jgi:hypothetical protein
MMSLDGWPSHAGGNNVHLENPQALVVLSGATPAWSQDLLDDPLVTQPQHDGSVPADEAYHPPKSHAMAYGLMLAGTVVPVAAAFALPSGEAALTLAFGGLLIGPSAGQFYAGSGGRGLAGVGIRALGLPVGLIVGGIMANGASDEPFAELVNFLGGMMLGAGVMWVIGTTYSVIDTPRAVNRANERARRAFLSNASLSPVLYPARDEHNVMRWAPGLAFSASF